MQIRNPIVKSIDLDQEDEHVKIFLSTLAHDAEETLLRLNGQPLLKVLPPYGMSDAEKKALIDERKDLMRQARDRTKGISAGVIETEIEDSINEVRRRNQSS